MLCQLHQFLPDSHSVKLRVDIDGNDVSLATFRLAGKDKADNLLLTLNY